MRLTQSSEFERDYHDPAKRSNANSIQVYFKDGTRAPLARVDYPLGHPRRRAHGIPLLLEKFEANVGRVFAGQRRDVINALCLDRERLAATPVHEFFDLLV
jgi:2-methylcitrate dehydratase PrpD